ncbi:uncharacterized protein PHALS_06570 [Plasmopara halstedii]|uniref:Uncharacterized protein n=1 Tax=Plasmopara halstedii TaxID=4781 RepID=A0A0P1B537_PLAHL|nr:uncharacterized protein PHALS_06570 [Plasmopara halstedii]CEG48765.1 hypothetical protein PHALS_06570 [Plasmopara halstedii]|eukprot:XP_024585134.1 hypothetical protein PHALS_06570 [Plasmopara halstedii]
MGTVVDIFTAANISARDDPELRHALVLLLDFSKAYDSLARDFLLATLRRLGVHRERLPVAAARGNVWDPARMPAGTTADNLGSGAALRDPREHATRSSAREHVRGDDGQRLRALKRFEANGPARIMDDILLAEHAGVDVYLTPARRDAPVGDFKMADTMWKSGAAVVCGVHRDQIDPTNASFVAATAALFRRYLLTAKWDGNSLQIAVDDDAMLSFARLSCGRRRLRGPFCHEWLNRGGACEYQLATAWRQMGHASWPPQLDVDGARCGQFRAEAGRPRVSREKYDLGNDDRHCQRITASDRVCLPTSQREPRVQGGVARVPVVLDRTPLSDEHAQVPASQSLRSRPQCSSWSSALSGARVKVYHRGRG